MKRNAILITSMKSKKIASAKTFRIRTLYRNYPRRPVSGACVRANFRLDTDGSRARWFTAKLNSCGLHSMEPAKHTLVLACRSLQLVV